MEGMRWGVVAGGGGGVLDLGRFGGWVGGWDLRLSCGCFV